MTQTDGKYTGSRYSRVTYKGDDGKNHSFWAQETEQGPKISYFISVDNEGCLLDIHHLIANTELIKIEPARITKLYGEMVKVKGT